MAAHRVYNFSLWTVWRKRKAPKLKDVFKVNARLVSPRLFVTDEEDVFSCEVQRGKRASQAATQVGRRTAHR